MAWLLVLLAALAAATAAKNGDSGAARGAKASNSSCSTPSLMFQKSSPPYDNYFFSDCHSSSQVVVTSPLADSNLTLIGPRLIVAWPAGDSGVATYFAPRNGTNGTLSIQVQNSSAGNPLGPIYEQSTNATNGNATVGVTGQISFNASALLNLAILGSIRTIRDFVEGPSVLQPIIQDAITYNKTSDGGAMISRMWLDNITTTSFSLTPTRNQTVTINNGSISLDAGTYTFNASFNYPQMTQLTPNKVLNSNDSSLIMQNTTDVDALSFLSYTNKLTAGAWRFLTYFGRDSMIAALLLQPVLSQGDGSAMEAVIAAVLERLNSTDGTACHEEIIGTTAPNFLPSTSNRTYGDLALLSAERIMNITAPFATNQTQDNLLHLKQGFQVGNWRDSTYGLGGGRIPYDVNTGLVPAALRSIAHLSAAGIFPSHPEWNSTANRYAQVWEDQTLSFFEVTVSADTASSLLSNYTHSGTFNGSSSVSELGGAGVTYYAVALDGFDSQSQVAVMNSDDCFRHFLLNTTNQTQLTAFVNATANNVRRRFPAGLLTDVGMVVANPAYGGRPFYAANWTTSAYHGTVVWSWPMAMMARGLEQQLGRCSASNASSNASSPSSPSSNATATPQFCSDPTVYTNVKTAYNALWDTIDANRGLLDTEVWSWVFRGGRFDFVEFGTLPPPPGTNTTEADIFQLWSLAFLAVTRNETLR